MEKLLKEMKCIGCEGGVPALTETQAKELLQQVPAWKLSSDNKSQFFIGSSSIDSFFEKKRNLLEETDNHLRYESEVNRIEEEV